MVKQRLHPEARRSRRYIAIIENENLLFHNFSLLDYPTKIHLIKVFTFNVCADLVRLFMYVCVHDLSVLCMLSVCVYVCGCVCVNVSVYVCLC